MRKWQAVFSEAEREIAKKAGFGQAQAFGERPAFLIIDVNRAFVGSKPQPILQSIDEYSTSCGEDAWPAMNAIAELLEACRGKRIPVVYTTNDLAARQFCWGPTKASPPSVPKDLQGQEIADRIKPLETEVVIKKTRASAFFGTPLLGILDHWNVDSLLVAGTTTSGCVRASVVDAFSNGFTCFVVEECTFDRFPLSHLVNLWDMHAKYADVITMEEARRHLAAFGASAA